jgi:hypothetical protein
VVRTEDMGHTSGWADSLEKCVTDGIETEICEFGGQRSFYGGGAVSTRFRGSAWPSSTGSIGPPRRDAPRSDRPRPLPQDGMAPERAQTLIHLLPHRHREKLRSSRPQSRQLTGRHLQTLPRARHRRHKWGQSSRIHLFRCHGADS